MGYVNPLKFEEPIKANLSIEGNGISTRTTKTRWYAMFECISHLQIEQMTTDKEQPISLAEERLRQAMLASDVEALDALISSDLVFTNHLGQVFRKQDDIALHRSGVLKFHSLEPSEMQMKVDGPIAVVSVRMKLSGAYSGTPFAADLRYTRVWRGGERDTWRIVAGHSSVVQE